MAARINYRALKLYLNSKLKEEKEFAQTRNEEIDIQQSREFIESLEKAIDNAKVQEIVSEWNKLIDNLETLKSKAARIDYDLGKYFEHKLK